ncbi:hypothetical protein [Aquicoccus sp.]|uniref:hypothetical protein n=1 Tax=Aquicoccus sp. TaxID=2055851 RepID=UPI00356601D8
MPFNVKCWTRLRSGLVIVTLFLSGCAGVDSDAPPGVCPPEVQYSRAEQVRVADEMAALPEGALIVEWLTDYAVLRDQVRACRRVSPSP